MLQRTILFWTALLLFPVLAYPAQAQAEDSPVKNLESFFPAPESIDPHLDAEKYQEFSGERLFDYINGGAEVYLDLGFIKVGAREYLITLAEEEVYFTLDLYDMGSEKGAFGIFSQERYGDTPPAEVGVMSAIRGAALNFWTQRYYVKIRADMESEGVDELMKKMARAVSERIGDPGEAPEELALFPAEHRLAGKDKYSAHGLLGISFLQGFSGTYRKEGMEILLGLTRFEKEEEAIQAEKRLVDHLKKACEPSPDGQGFLFQEDKKGSGRFFRVGPYLATVRFPGGADEKAPWVEETVERFFAKILEAGMEAKTQDALKALMGGAGEKP